MKIEKDCECLLNTGGYGGLSYAALVTYGWKPGLWVKVTKEITYHSGEVAWIHEGEVKTLDVKLPDIKLWR